MTTLTANEINVFKAIINSAAGNGYDFGFADEVLADTGMNRHAFAGTMSSLQEKDVIWTETLRVNGQGPRLTQIMIDDELLERLYEGGEGAEAEILAELAA